MYEQNLKTEWENFKRQLRQEAEKEEQEEQHENDSHED